MDPDSRIAQLQRKLEIELKCKEGGEAMLAELTDKNAVAQCQASLAHSIQRIQFLQSEINKFTQSSTYHSNLELNPTHTTHRSSSLSSSSSSSSSPIKKKESTSMLIVPSTPTPDTIITSTTTTSSFSSSDPPSKSSFFSYFRKVIPHRPRSSVTSFSTSSNSHFSSPDLIQPTSSSLTPLPSTLQLSSSSSSPTSNFIPSSSSESMSFDQWKHQLQCSVTYLSQLLPQGPEPLGSVSPTKDTNLDWSRSGVGYSNAKISNKLRDLTYKLDLDLKYKQAAEKLDGLLTHPKNETKSTKPFQVSLVQAECQARIDALKASIQKYNSLFVPEWNEPCSSVAVEDVLEQPSSTQVSLLSPFSSSSSSSSFSFSSSSPTSFSKKAQTGTFYFYLSTIRLPPSVKNAFSKPMTSHYQVLLRMDGTTKWKSKLMKIPKDRKGSDTILDFQEANEFIITKAMEVELVVAEVDKSEHIFAINGMLWFRFNDFLSSPSCLVTQGWFELDPTGQVLITLGFFPHPVQAHRKKALSKLGRQGAVLRKKPMIEFTSHGHTFMFHSFSTIMKCALCEEFIGMASCYVCFACQFACHKKCAPKIVVPCMAQPRPRLASESNTPTTTPSPHDPKDTTQKHSKENEDILAVPIQLHRIPHRFQPSQQLSVHWCGWCGLMLPLGRTFSKCTECDFTAHPGCCILVPNFCGMSMQRANLMLQEIRLAQNLKSTLSNLTNSSSSSSKLSFPSTHSSTTTPSSLSQPTTQGPTTSVVSSSSSSLPEGPKWSEDDFQFLSVLGRGNFGKVMLAEEKSTQRLVAIKILKKSFVIENGEVESTLSEKRIFMIANQSQHPFLINLYACFQSETHLYFVMEYISGGDLMLHIQRQQFTEQRARFYACEVLLALEFFHQNNIIYRDLKLDNIMLNLDGHIKLADYGLCKENMGYNMTTNTFCGTPEFMAPEILQEQQYTRVVDWWAFGVLIYEMVCGQSPFHGEDEDEIFESILHDEVLYPITMSRDAVSICQLLLTKDPRKRLGQGPMDALEIKQHPFFKGVDWDRVLAKQVIPPFLPTLQSPKDVNNFDDEFTKEPPLLTPVPSMLDALEQKEFDGFSFIDGSFITTLNEVSEASTKLSYQQEEGIISS